MQHKPSLTPAPASPDLEAGLYGRVRDLVVSARQTVARGVDLVQVRTNFEIGRHMVEFEQQGEHRAAYGKVLVQRLADQLTQEFGRGFSKSNLEYMRRFFITYQDRPQIAQFNTGQLASQWEGARPFCLSWTHYVFLLGINNADERSFYEIETADQSWNLNELKRQFNTSLYERLALSRDPSGIRQLAAQGQIVAEAKDLLKEPLVLEFLGLAEQAHYSESELETAIVSKVERFLLELGKGFLFEARQKRFTFDDDHFFVDLVFYNRLLRCYVLIDLKLGKKKHEALVEITLPHDANIHAANTSSTCRAKKSCSKSSKNGPQTWTPPRYPTMTRCRNDS